MNQTLSTPEPEAFYRFLNTSAQEFHMSKARLIARIHHGRVSWLEFGITEMSDPSSASPCPTLADLTAFKDKVEKWVNRSFKLRHGFAEITIFFKNMEIHDLDVHFFFRKEELPHLGWLLAS